MISFNPRNFDKVQAFIKSCPHGTKKSAVYAVAKYFLGNDWHGLQHYPTRTSPNYTRTGTLKHGWHMEGTDYRKRVVNLVPYAQWVMGDTTQVHYMRRYGWRKVAKVLEDNILGAMRAGRAAVRKWLKDREVK